MYTIDRVIQDVKNYLIYKDQIVILCKDGRILLEGEELSDFGTDLEIWLDFLVYNNQENQVVFLNLESKEFFVYPDVSAINTKSSNGMKFGVNSSEKLVHFEIENDGLKMVDTGFQYNWEMIEIRNSYSYYLWDGNSVKLMTAGEVKWYKDFSEIGTIRKFLGECPEFVWLTVTEKKSEPKKISLVALDLGTGEIKKNISNDSYSMHPVNVELLKDKQTILSIWGKISANARAESPVLELSSSTGEVFRNTYSQALYETNLKIVSWKYVDGKIYFDAASDTINSTHIGVMDYQTLELEWYEEIKNRKAGLRNLMVTGSKIFFMDSGNQLFVYRK